MDIRWDRDSILKLGRDFMLPRVLLTAVELGLFPLLAERPLTLAEVAASIQGDERATRIVLDALAAAGLLEKDGDTYRLPPALRPILGPGDETVLPMLGHCTHLWRTWANLTQVVRAGAPTGLPTDLPQVPQEHWDAFIGGMHVIGTGTAPRIVSRIDLRGVRKLLDVGGGSGVYTIAMLQAEPALRAVLFDQPPVIEIARTYLAAAGLLDRVDLVPGDFTKDVLPPGNDLACLSAIIHMNSPAENRALYHRIAEALVPGGRLVIRDHVMDPSRTRPRAGALFAVNMLVGTPGGDTYTLEEIEGDLRAAGFSEVSLLPGGEGMDSLVVAVRAEDA